MADKRYQVFVSSTYQDLALPRAKVIQAVLAMNCIPTGMELFPAADEDQLRFIERIIDDCDYYVLIVAGPGDAAVPGRAAAACSRRRRGAPR